MKTKLDQIPIPPLCKSLSEMGHALVSKVVSLNPTFVGPKSGRKCYITPTFSGVPNKGDKIKEQKKNNKKT